MITRSEMVYLDDETGEFLNQFSEEYRFPKSKVFRELLRSFIGRDKELLKILERQIKDEDD